MRVSCARLALRGGCPPHGTGYQPPLARSDLQLVSRFSRVAALGGSGSDSTPTLSHKRGSIHHTESRMDKDAMVGEHEGMRHHPCPRRNRCRRRLACPPQAHVYRARGSQRGLVFCGRRPRATQPTAKQRSALAMVLHVRRRTSSDLSRACWLSIGIPRNGMARMCGGGRFRHAPHLLKHEGVSPRPDCAMESASRPRRPRAQRRARARGKDLFSR